MKNRVVCIIPARGGSKRIPRKNIKEFLGRPVISYSIQAAIASNIFDEVYVSTDDQEIAEVAQNFGANADVLRTSDNSSDFATTSDVILEVLDYKKFKDAFIICCLYPVTPLIKSQTLCDGYKYLLEKSVNSVFTVTKFSYPIQRSLERDENGLMNFHQKENRNARTQDLKDFFHDAGMFYFVKAHVFKKEKDLLCKPSYGILMNEYDVQDIDNMNDWEMAKLKFQLRIKRQ